MPPELLNLTDIPLPGDLSAPPSPHALMFISGAHAQRLETPGSDVDTVTVYTDPRDLLRPFPRLPDTQHNPGGHHGAYNLPEFLKLLIRGRPDLVTLCATQLPRVSGTPASQALQAVLAELRGHLVTQAYAAGCLKHLQSVWEQAAPHPHAPPAPAPGQAAPLGSKYLMHGLRMAFLAQDALNGSPVTLLTDEQRDTLRRWKAGLVPYPDMHATLAGWQSTLLPRGYHSLRSASEHLPGPDTLREACNDSVETHLGAL